MAPTSVRQPPGSFRQPAQPRANADIAGVSRWL